MSIDRPWVRAELPWLTSGPLYRVHTTARPLLDSYIERSSYLRIDLNGQLMTSRQAAHDQLAQAFHFPAHYGHNWDAFADCYSDFADDHRDELVCVVWHDIHLMAAEAPATLAEVGWALLQDALADPEDAPWQIDIFTLGHGEDFDRPRDTHGLIKVE